MDRIAIVNKIGIQYHTPNIEGGEYSYIQEAGSRVKLEKAVGHPITHYKLDIRFEMDDIVILVETKNNFIKADEKQLAQYLEEERALHRTKKIICILANTNNDKIKVWKSFVDDEHILPDEKILDNMEHYAKIFCINKINDREKVLKNTYDLNELLHKMDIDEKLRSQFVGTTLLYLKSIVEKKGEGKIDDNLKDYFNGLWYGIEIEEKAYGLATTNMLIHGDGNSNIKFKSCFDCEDFIKQANPDVILMNPPYNSKPIGIPTSYKKNWKTKAKNGKEDPTKGLVFIHFLSDVIKKMNKEKEENNESIKTVKLAVLLPVSAAIGTSSIISAEKIAMLENNTLEAVFTLPNEIFYPGASVCVCCMLFTLGQPHIKADGQPRTTFFGYCKEDGFKKKKNLGRIEQFDSNGDSKWRIIEQEWLDLFETKKVIDGKSATAIIDGNSEWLCEAYMKTDYSKLKEADFQQTLNNYLAYIMKEGKIYES